MVGRKKQKKPRTFLAANGPPPPKTPFPSARLRAPPHSSMVTSRKSRHGCDHTFPRSVPVAAPTPAQPAAGLRHALGAHSSSTRVSVPDTTWRDALMMRTSPAENSSAGWSESYFASTACAARMVCAGRGRGGAGRRDGAWRRELPRGAAAHARRGRPGEVRARRQPCGHRRPQTPSKRPQGQGGGSNSPCKKTRNTTSSADLDGGYVPLGQGKHIGPFIFRHTHNATKCCTPFSPASAPPWSLRPPLKLCFSTALCGSLPPLQACTLATTAA